MNRISTKTQFARFIVFALLLLLIGLGRRYGWITSDEPVASTNAKPVPTAAPETAPAPKPVPPADPSAADPLLIRNVTLRDQDGATIYRGDIDLRPTLDRIAAGHRLRFAHDGTTFQNRERRLPQKPPGYYAEWIVPTPGETGPGPQRLVTGADGDVWYTADHYLSFRRVPFRLKMPPSGADR